MLLHAYAIKSPYNDVQLDLVKRHVILEQETQLFFYSLFFTVAPMFFFL